MVLCLVSKSGLRWRIPLAQNSRILMHSSQAEATSVPLCLCAESCGPRPGRINKTVYNSLLYTAFLLSGGRELYLLLIFRNFFDKFLDVVEVFSQSNAFGRKGKTDLES